MPANFRPSLVNYRQIDFADSSFSLTPDNYRKPDQNLLDSVGACGILHPPLLLENGTGSLTIVAGRRRLHAAREALGCASAICLILPVDTNPVEALAVSLNDTLLRGKISLAEQALFFQKILAHLDEDQAAARFLPVLGLKPQRRQLQGLLCLLELEEPLLNALHDGRLPEGVARDLLALGFTDRLSLHETMEALELSFSNRKKITAACRELAARENVSIMSLLGTSEVREIFASQGNIPQKTAALMRWLERRCQPGLNAAEDEFRHFASSLKLPNGASLSHSQSFEDDRLQLALTFASRDELAKVWAMIKTMLPSGGQEKA